MKKNKPTVSIIIPVHNGEKYIKRCLDSILAVQDEEVEIVVVNDGSTDSTSHILKEYLESEIVVINEECMGVSHARNAGMDAANGEYIAFADADDQIVPEKFKRLLSDLVACEHPSDVYMYGYLERCGGHEKINLPPRAQEMEGRDPIACMQTYLSDFSFSYRHEAKRFPRSCWLYLIRRSLLQEKEQILFPENIKHAEDLCFCLKLMQHATNITFIYEPIYIYNRVDGSETMAFQENRWKEWSKVHQYLKEEKLLDTETLSRLIYWTGKDAIKNYVARGKGLWKICTLIREVISSPTFLESITAMHYDNFTVFEKMDNFCFYRGLAFPLYCGYKLRYEKNRFVERRGE